MVDSKIKLVNVDAKPSDFQIEEIYTRSFSGFFRNLRIFGGSLLFLLYFGAVWLTWNDSPAVLFDIAGRRFYLFSITLYPQDLILLTLLLSICAFGLFFITTLAGRVWCGYFCPQSIFTWVFLRIEHWIEGDRNKRISRSKKKYQPSNIVRRLAKHACWLSLSFIVALTFVGYFVPIRELIFDIAGGETNSWETFWLLFFTLATYGNAGWLREKVCLYMCPYARFQSVMYDNDTLVVAYDVARGEPRKKLKTSDNMAGDCIDCTLCVQVCPTGIDIRNGLQIGCISCAACVDACNGVMDRLGRSRNLIGYTTDNKLLNKSTHLLRPRLIGYFFALVCSVVLFYSYLVNRDMVSLDINRDRQALYYQTEDNRIENVYVFQIQNKYPTTETFSLSATGLDQLKYAGQQTITLSPGEIGEMPVRLSVPLESTNNQAINHLLIAVKNVTNKEILKTKLCTFIAPLK